MVKRKRQIKMLGDSRGIHLSLEDVRDFEVGIDSEVDISNIKKTEVEKEFKEVYGDLKDFDKNPFLNNEKDEVEKDD